MALNLPESALMAEGQPFLGAGMVIPAALMSTSPAAGEPVRMALACIQTAAPAYIWKPCSLKRGLIM